jgi:hypothetical protein
MTREIVLADVRLGLDDTTAGDPLPRMALEDATKQFPRDDFGIAREEL